MIVEQSRSGVMPATGSNNGDGVWCYVAMAGRAKMVVQRVVAAVKSKGSTMVFHDGLCGGG